MQDGIMSAFALIAPAVSTRELYAFVRPARSAKYSQEDDVDVQGESSYDLITSEDRKRKGAEGR